ncbi:MAG: hypothetical protein ACPGR8_16045, partial [Limisphaerales bacterium]
WARTAAHVLTYNKRRIRNPEWVYWRPRPARDMALYGYNRPYRAAVVAVALSMQRREAAGLVSLGNDLWQYILVFCFRLHFTPRSLPSSAILRC